jgi:membrane-bound ClpP family serine protease
MSPILLLAATSDAWLLGQAVTLFVIALILIVAEVFLISGGLLGIGAAAAAVFSIQSAFQYDQTTGWVFLVASPILGFAVLRFGIYQLKQSPLVTQATVQGGSGYGSSASSTPVVGDIGTLLTPARPGGRAHFAHGTWDVQMVSGACEAGCQIRIVEVSGPRILACLNQPPTSPDSHKE